MSTFNRQSFDLTGKVALITGGASGLGQNYAIALSLYGADIFVVSRQQTGWETTRQKVEANGRQIAFLQQDITEEGCAPRIIQQVIDHFGHLDILVNNAGMQRRDDVLAFKDADWQRVIDVDLTGVVLTDKYVVQQMVKQQSGSVINMSSILGVVGAANSQAYSAAKAGVANFTRSQAVTYAPQGIRFNAVAPGYVNTPLLQTLPSDVTDSMVAKMPVGRLAEPSEIANVIAFLASDDASIVTGAVINADGGYTAQ